jgi:hypothetical protein
MFSAPVIEDGHKDLKFSHPRRTDAARDAKFATDTHDALGKTTVTGGMQLVRTADSTRKRGLI